MLYGEMFRTVFSKLDVNSIHSVSLGSFRLPDTFFKKLVQLYPDDKLLAPTFVSDGKMTSYATQLQIPMQQYCQNELLNYIPESIYFPCFSDDLSADLSDSPCSKDLVSKNHSAGITDE